MFVIFVLVTFECSFGLIFRLVCDNFFYNKIYLVFRKNLFVTQSIVRNHLDNQQFFASSKVVDFVNITFVRKNYGFIIVFYFYSKFSFPIGQYGFVVVSNFCKSYRNGRVEVDYLTFGNFLRKSKIANQKQKQDPKISHKIILVIFL